MKKAMKKAAPKKAAKPMAKKPMPPAKPEGSSTAQMMMKFGGKTGAPAKRVGGARAYDAQIGKKKGMNKG